jgi:glycosyltransferase involved in cell wall biosynthesis
VLILEPAGNLWGSERVLLDFLGSISNAKWTIGICCPRNSPIIVHLKNLQFPVFPTFISNLHLKSSAKRALATFRFLGTVFKFRPDLIHVNQAGATRIALFVGRLMRVPVITHVRMADDVDYLKTIPASSGALPKIICISHYIRNLFGREQKHLSGRLLVLYDPYVPRNSWSETPDAFREGEPTICCVGRITKTKGQDIVLRAVAFLKSENIRVRLLMVGAGLPNDSFLAELKELAESLGIADQVTWPGFRDDVLDYIKGCAALVCPSYSEALGRVIFEAWDAGILPVAWSESGGSAEVIGRSAGGLLYARQDAESMSRALRAAIDMTANDRAEQIQRGREWVKTQCDPKKFTASVLTLWDDVLFGR